MIAPQPGKPLILYLTSTAKSIGALLVQEIEGVERPVYYISRKIQGAEERYTPVERHCLALVFTAQKLRHYFLSFPVQLVTKSDPVRYLLSRPALSGRIARWLLALAEFEITCVTPRAIKCQALADLLAQFPSGQCEPLEEALPEKSITNKPSKSWTLSFDGAAGGAPGGAGIVLQSDEGEMEYMSYKLGFACSNNEAEYEALILGLLAANFRGISRLKIVGDSKLIILQTSGEYALKEPTLAPYRATVQRLMERFEAVDIIHRPRLDNRFPDALATLGAKTEFDEEKVTIEIIKKTEPSIIDELGARCEEDWRDPVLKQLVSGKGTLPIAEVAQFTVLRGELYYRGPQGWIARCVGLGEVKTKLRQIHDKTCGENEISLYRRVQRQGYYWPSMKEDAAKVLRTCQKCMLYAVEAECCLMEELD
ncbi:hypothetical protein RHGRI_030950 [Rhododendron griersonianum]|uniref:RNase H type-1 domain-containing protein n=1 Tax=Rhododendron griersonianum TaxID=479676 RepID=A0AAV6I979_9ERIC|nr:hypothetical protein RHGRI_030950 [Rhododendron griersonianum]